MSIKKVKLNPCPFCGGKVEIDTTGMFRITYILCSGCGACISFRHRETLALTIAAYNVRDNNGKKETQI
jgi:Pyruvate/2-oxoacid:ferredoxin oxidoreductase delta subunit